jgi:ABC-type antimicrobial peptide transport system permease subunit
VLLLRTGDGDRAAVAGILRGTVRAIDGRLPLDRLMTLAELIDQTQWNGRVSATLAYAIALIAFALAMVGLFAVTAYRVGRQTPEIGLRMALGAEPRQIAVLVLGGATGHLGAGVIVGLVLTYAFDYLFVPPTTSLVDPIVLAPLILVVAGLALAACALPALRAARIDPAVALRCD